MLLQVCGSRYKFRLKLDISSNDLLFSFLEAHGLHALTRILNEVLILGYGKEVSSPYYAFT